MYDSDAVLWGTTAKTVAANPAAIAEYFQDAGKRPNARVVFGEQNIRVYGDVGVTQVTTRSPMSEMANGYRVRRALPCVPKSRRTVAHRWSSFIRKTEVVPCSIQQRRGRLRPL